MGDISSEIDNLVISYQIDTFYRLLELVDGQLDKDFEEWKGKAKESLAGKRDREDYSYLEDSYIDDYIQQCEFKEIFLHSFFVTLVASFENELLQCCERSQELSGNPISVKDFGGGSYSRNAKTYLERLGVAFPKKSTEWQVFTKYQRLRNCILHQGGFLSAKADVVSFGKRKEILNEEESGWRVALTKEFCLEVLETYHKFFRKLNRAHGQWLRSLE